MNKTLKYFISDIFSNHPKQFFIVLTLLLIESFVLATSVLAIVPLADYFLDPELKNPSKITVIAIRTLLIFDLNPSYMIFAAIFIVINFLRAIFALAIKYFIYTIQFSIVKFLTLNLLKNIFIAKWNFFNNLAPGKLLNTLNNELGRVGSAIGQLASMLAMCFQLLTYLIIPFMLDFKLTIYTMTIAGVLGIPFLLLNKLSRKWGKITTSTANHMMGVMNETTQAAKIILGFGNRKKAILDNEYAVSQHIIAAIKSMTIGNLTNLFFKPLAILAVIVSVGISIDTEKNISEYVAVFWSLYAVVPVLANLINLNVVIHNFLPSYEQVNELEKKALENKEISTGEEFKDFKDKINFKEISFNYLNKKNIIRDCSFEIKKNHITAIVGKSGSGKSTIIDILLGLQKPVKGEIFFDKIKLNNFNMESYRKKISVVLQDPFLFYSSIRDNLLWSNDNASEEEIIESLKLANAYEFVMNLPLKLDSFVGDRGLELSGGERQRLALARAIIRKPKLLILDEATSSLDQHSELLIKQSIKKIAKFTTILIIAHRSSTINIADKIYVLKEGKVVESGYFDKLAKTKDSEFLKITHELS